MMVVILGLLVLIAAYTLVGSNWDFALITLALASFFPITAIVYESSHSDIRKKELARDLKSLVCEVDEGKECIESCEKFFSAPNYAKHYILTILVTILGLSLFFPPPAFLYDSLRAKDTLHQAMQFGFVGAYLFSIFWVYRRYTTRDFQPSVYLYCTLTIIAGLAFNYVAFDAIIKLSPPATSTAAGAVGATTGSAGIWAGFVPIIAFSFGFFPLVG